MEMFLPGDTDSANQFVDQMLDSLTKQEKFDPLHVKDHNTYFDKNIACIHLKGDIKLTNTEITGLSRTKRHGDVDLRTDDDEYYVAMRLGDQQMMVASDIHIDLGKHIHKDLQAEINIGYIEVQFALSLEGGKFKLEQFNVEELKHVKVKVHGLHILNPLVGVIADVIVVIFNKQIKELVSKKVRPIIEKKI